MVKVYYQIETIEEVGGNCLYYVEKDFFDKYKALNCGETKTFHQIKDCLNNIGCYEMLEGIHDCSSISEIEIVDEMYKKGFEMIKNSDITNFNYRR